MEKVIAYYRKSIKPGKKTKEEGVEYQRLKLLEYAKDNNYEVVREFIDVGVSGTSAGRPEFDELLSYLESTYDKISQIIFYSIDRLGRDTLVNIDLITMIIEKIGKASFIKEGISTSSENFNMIFLIFSSMAHEEREHLLGRLRDGRKSKLLVHKNFDGNFAPLGLKKESGRLKRIDDSSFIDSSVMKQEMEIVESIFLSYLTGNKSLRQIATELNEQYGVTKRNKLWDYKSVQYILQNEIYIGVLSGVLEKSDSYYVPNANVEPLIDKSVFLLVQEKLKYETTGRKKKDQVGLPPLILCRFCGNILQKENKNILCSKCKVENDIGELKVALHEQLKNYVERFDTRKYFVELKYKLIFQYQLKLWKLETYLKKMLERKDDIRNLEVTNEVRDRMTRENTRLIVNVFKEKEIIQMIICFFQTLIDEEAYLELSSRSYSYLINLPFITLVDLVDQRTDFLFLRSPLKEKGLK